MSLPISPPNRLALIREAVEDWKKQLVGLGGRNRLLFYRHLRVGTLDLSPLRAHVNGETRAAMLRGSKVRLSSLFPDPSHLPDALKRARTIAAKASENFEERGIETLYLAWGMAKWTPERTGSAEPASPVLLAPLRISRVGAAEQDYELVISGDFEVNPTLLHFLSTKFASDVDGDSMIEGWTDSDSGLDPTPIFHRVSKAASDVPGFRIADEVIIGNFFYAKLPMVRDLEQNLEALAANDIISAIAGDSDARQRIADLRFDGELDQPDHTPPADEFLILDADASQNYAINAALAGESFVIQGPPGTGKSQTISNLIASLVARGKRVLFVAEKRAAIDAVIKRLDATGLSELVMDLHGGATSKRELAAQLGRRLQSVARTPLPDHSHLHDQLERRREELNGHDDAMHSIRAPWEVSAYQVMVGLLALGPCIEDLRLRLTDLRDLDQVQAEQLAGDIHEYTNLGGFLANGDGLWSRGTVQDSEDASTAAALLHSVRGDKLPSVSLAVKQLCARFGFKFPQTLRDWEYVLDLFGRVNRTLQAFAPEVFEFADRRGLKHAIAETESASRGLFRRAMAQLFSSTYRNAAKGLRYLATGSGQPTLADLRDLALDAVGQVDEWRSLGGIGRPEQTPEAADVAVAFAELLDGLADLSGYAPSISVEDSDIGQIEKLLDSLAGSLSELATLPRLHELETAFQEAGFGLLLARLADRGADPNYAVDSLWHMWLISIHEAITLQDPRIGAFNGSAHLEGVTQFRMLDEQQVTKTAERVARKAAEFTVVARDRFPDEAQLVRAQARRKRGHLPLRQLILQAPNVVTALKPCWAMSPLLVSQLLPADGNQFDVVIFDEASQVTPADAITSLLRAPQAIVAGDDRQLPPTMFFVSDGEVQEESDDGSSLTVGFQSILDVLNAILRPFTLTWHYRSEDERLIAFSNAYLYDRMLTTFPGPEGEECLRFVPVTETAGRSAGESSPAEVAAVVRLILEHTRKEPELSLGVITMGIAHSNQIQDALRLALSEDDSLETFFDEESEESFFVKNLERVQGDERDAIILSVGYGARNADGRLRYNFGPINQDGGERRLNVAITRARRQLTLVSTFSHHDMDPSRSSARGVELLRRYFAYVSTNGSDLGALGDENPYLNPFERSVRDRLADLGVPLRPQYGESGFKIDFAAEHPDKPGRFVLAIECDGASYHSSPTARDRDRLRQQVLERMGWRFHRIWSTDWFRDPDREVQKAYDAWETAVAAADQAEIRLTPDEMKESLVGPAVEAGRPERVGIRPSLRYRQAINSYPFGKLVDLAHWIESDTLLRTEDQLLEEMMVELGLQRRGRVIVDTLLRAIRRSRARDEEPSIQGLL